MRIFVAGASGAIGKRLVPLLVENGHEIVGTTRSPEKVGSLRASGAEPAVVDLLDPEAVIAAVRSARPEVVVHEATAFAATSLTLWGAKTRFCLQIGLIKGFERSFSHPTRGSLRHRQRDRSCHGSCPPIHSIRLPGFSSKQAVLFGATDDIPTIEHETSAYLAFRARSTTRTLPGRLAPWVSSRSSSG
jgi:dihydrodipicolinate reductase